MLFRDKAIFFFFYSRKFYQSKLFCTSIYTTEMNTCIMLMNAHANWLIEEKQCSSHLVHKVFNILTFAIQLVSQAEHVRVQGKQTWAGSSLVM